METPDDHADRTARSYRERREARKEGTDVMATGFNGSSGGAPFAGLEQLAEHVHVEDLARHQLAQESNLTQAVVATLKAWRRRSGK